MGNPMTQFQHHALWQGCDKMLGLPFLNIEVPLVKKNVGWRTPSTRRYTSRLKKDYFFFLVVVFFFAAGFFLAAVFLAAGFLATFFLAAGFFLAAVFFLAGAFFFVANVLTPFLNFRDPEAAG